MYKERIIVYDVFAHFPDNAIEEVYVATTRDKEKAKVLVKAMKDCGTEGFIAGRCVTE